ncbi:allose kinase [Conservatibacter flavescens]|uniref:Allose kinase n=1 Tax=Conservatibacter flavescens TaxID=28161 RepID=A0A2M8S2G6_9PAST|nr:allose kinase [Conservatibacter flavescens]PJG85298.1 allose kinase [Conservatibacter flavescens]
MKNEKVVIGVDMGATHIRICVMDMRGDVLVTERKKTSEILTQGLVHGLITFCERFLSTAIECIVVGLPAAISADRKRVLSVPNLSVSQEELDQLSSSLSQHFHCAVFLERDVNLQMIYDIHHYKLTDKLVLAAYLGSGMGFAIWNKGHLFIGAHGVAGELGHIPYGDEDIRCGCGNYGCLETTCSGIALKRWFEHNQFDYPIDLIFKKSSQETFIQDYLVQAAKAISTAVNLFDSEVLILGGGVMDMQDFPIEKLKSLIGKYVRKPLPYNELKILKAESSSFNGAIGAALYAQSCER